ncbi:MAG: hypothetical protein AB7F94_14625 [Nitrospira sp.]
MILRPVKFAESPSLGCGTHSEAFSQVLKAVILNGPVFYNAGFSVPWAANSVDAHTVASYLSSNLQCVIIFLLLTEGRGYAHVQGDDG